MSWKVNIIALKLRQPLNSAQVAAKLGHKLDLKCAYHHQDIKMTEGCELAIASLNGYHILVNLDLCRGLVSGDYEEFEVFDAEEVLAGYTYFDMAGFCVYRQGELVRRYSEGPEGEGTESEGSPLPFEAACTFRQAGQRIEMDPELLADMADVFSVEEAIFSLLREPLGGFYDEYLEEFSELLFQLFEGDIEAAQASWFRNSGGAANRVRPKRIH